MPYKKMSLKIIKTSDGSDTIYNSELNETYHSLHGSINESNIVYIKNGLEHYLNKTKKNNIKILEIGFGTGLNFLLTHLFFEKREEKVFYHTLEPFPLPDEIIKKLNYVSEIGEEYRGVFNLSHSNDNDKRNNITENLKFLKSNNSLENIKLSYNYDIIYYDAFAPSKQPSIWVKKNLEKVFSHMEDNSILVTYCSSGQFKRDLKTTGFKVEVLPGPKGKKEMVRASR
jgi:tRNA U34 5-methylaminomethyl-2-thiouridine-forming methyltransferase MnmC|tara:strand:- start:2010 stop:2693 length:684 start_codon:yes stop_codon:yes gene_type:complete